MITLTLDQWRQMIDIEAANMQGRTEIAHSADGLLVGYITHLHKRNEELALLVTERKGKFPAIDLLVKTNDVIGAIEALSQHPTASKLQMRQCLLEIKDTIKHKLDAVE